MSDYAHPYVLVTTDWVAQHAKDPDVAVIEVDVDTTSYAKGHIDGAIGWNWQTDLQDRIVRDVVDFHRRARARGLAVPDLEETFYGMTEFRIEDPDGNRRWIGQVAAS